MEGIQGKVAIVTGSSRGIGRSIALRLAKEGADIVVNYRKETDSLAQLVDDIEALGRKVAPIQGDVSVFSEAKSMVDKAVDIFGTVDILVNNAGITKDGLLLRMKEEDFDKVLSVNLKGTFNCIRHVTPIMVKKRSGKIISLSSVVGVAGNAGQTNYSAAKAGIIGLTKSTARELASRGINVNAVAPGFINTNMTAVLSDKVKEETLRSIPLKKFGNPEDVAGVVAFLASEDANYITGQVIHIDGGMIM